MRIPIRLPIIGFRQVLIEVLPEKISQIVTAQPRNSREGTTAERFTGNLKHFVFIEVLPP